MKHIALAIVCLIAATVGCKKEVNTPPSSQRTEISTEKLGVTGKEIVLIDVQNFKLEQQEYAATFGDSAINTIKVNDTTLAFMVPSRKMGEQVFKLGFAENELKFSVTKFEAVPDPEAYMNTFMGDFDKELNALITYVDSINTDNTTIDKASLKKDIETARTNYQKAMSEFAMLPADAKQNCADFIKANRSVIDDGISAAQVLAGIKKVRSDDCADEETKLRRALCYTTNFGLAVVKLGKWTGVTIAAGALAQTVHPVAGIATAGVLIGTKVWPSLVYAIKTGEELVCFPFQSKEMDEVYAGKKAEEFAGGVPHPLTVKVNLRNVKETDGGTGSIMVKAFKNLQNIFDQIKAGAFLSRPEFAPEIVASDIPDAVDFLSVSTDNPNVSGSISGSIHVLEITFNTNENTEQNFNYTVTYNDGENTVKSAPIAAILKPVIYFIMDDKNDVFSGFTEFTSESERIFYFTTDRINKAPGVDYSKVEVKNVSNANVTVNLAKNASNFGLKLVNKNNWTETVSFEVHYAGKKVQTMTADVKPKASAVVVAGGNGMGSGLDQFTYPIDVFVDASGNVYVSDGANSRVMKWAPGASTGTRVAGGSGSGSDLYHLNGPRGIWVDNNGAVYVAEFQNERITKWASSSSGKVVAGEYTYFPNEMAWAGVGDIFMDQNSNLFFGITGSPGGIFKWAPGATKSSPAAGKGSGTSADRLQSPEGIFVDANGNIYIADRLNHRIQKWAPGASTGVTVAGGNGAGSAANQLNGPKAVVVDASGNIYITDSDNHRIQKWTPGATSGITVYGGVQGSSIDKLDRPDGLFMDANGYLYVADKYNQRVIKFLP